MCRILCVCCVCCVCVVCVVCVCVVCVVCVCACVCVCVCVCICVCVCVQIPVCAIFAPCRMFVMLLHPQSSPLTPSHIHTSLYTCRWYRPNYDLAKPLRWGLNMGCDFVKAGCLSPKWVWALRIPLYFFILQTVTLLLSNRYVKFTLFSWFLQNNDPATVLLLRP